MSRSDDAREPSLLRIGSVLGCAWAAWFATGVSRRIEFVGLAVATVVVAFLLSRSRARRVALRLAFGAAAVAFVAYALQPIPRTPLASLARIAAFGAAWVLAFPPNSATGGFRRRASRFALASTTFALAFAGAEWFCERRLGEPSVAIRAVGGGALFALDPELEQRFVPDFRGRFDYPEFRSEVFETNADGFRDPPWPSTRVEGERRVLILGDSMAVGWGVEQSENFPSLVAHELEPLGVRIFNASVPSYGPRHERVVLERMWERVRPDLVIACFYDGNDVGDVWRHFEQARPGSTRPPAESLASTERVAYIPDPRTPPLFAPRYWSLYSRLCQRVLLELSGRAPSLGIRSPVRPYNSVLLRSMRREPDGEVRDALQLTHAAFVAMESFVRARGARFCVLRLPAKIQVEPETFARVLDELGADPAEFDPRSPGREVLERCAAASIETIDLFDVLAARNANYFAEGHLSRAGQRCVAAELARRLRDGSWLR
jgi:hypothetical protein